MLNLKKAEESLLFLVILFLPTQLGKHFWPDFAYVYSLPVDYLSPTIYFWDFLVILLCLMFVVRGKHINRLALNLFFFFILTQSISLASSLANIGVGLVRLEQYFIAGLFGVYLASSKKSQILPTIFWGILYSMIFEAVLALLQFLRMGTIGLWVLGERNFTISTPGISKFDYYGHEFLRPYATFPHPNVLAGFMVLGIVFLNTAADLYANQKGLKTFFEKRKVKRFTLLTAVLGGITALFTVSRVVMIAGLVFATTFLTKNRDRLIMIVAVLILLPILYTRFSSLTNFDSLTYVRREELSRIALRVWSNSPILGVGLNNFIPTASDLILAGPSRFLQPVHDIFLLALSETGLVGLLGLCVFLGFPLFKLFKLNPKPYSIYSISSIWIIIIFLSLFDHYFLTLPQGIRMLFLFWGLSASFVQKDI